MRLVTLTVSPQISYCGFSAPITPAITGPWFRPENDKSVIWQGERFSLDGSYASGRPKNFEMIIFWFYTIYALMRYSYIHSMYCYANQSGSVSTSFCTKILIGYLPLKYASHLHITPQQASCSLHTSDYEVKFMGQGHVPTYQLSAGNGWRNI